MQAIPHISKHFFSEWSVCLSVPPI